MIPLVIAQELAEEIQSNLDPKNAPELDFISGALFKISQRKDLVELPLSRFHLD